MQTPCLERKILVQQAAFNLEMCLSKSSPSLTQQVSEWKYLSSCILNVAMECSTLIGENLLSFCRLPFHRVGGQVGLGFS